MNLWQRHNEPLGSLCELSGIPPSRSVALYGDDLWLMTPPKSLKCVGLQTRVLGFPFSERTDARGTLKRGGDGVKPHFQWIITISKNPSST